MKSCSSSIALGMFLCAFATILEAQPEVQVLYTGRLLGYARTPDFQRLRFRKLEPDNQTPLFEPVDDPKPSRVAAALEPLFIRARPADSASVTTVTLGSGDSFAVDFPSRSVLIEAYTNPATTPPTQVEQHYEAKDELAFDQAEKLWFSKRGVNEKQLHKYREAELSGTTQVGSDNVATYLLNAGYDAVVPGLHDFHYGPERLRQLARLLATGNGPGHRKVQMLAANLTIQSHRAKPQTPKSDEQRQTQRNYQLTGSTATRLDFALPKTILPWIRHFQLRNAYTAAGERLFDDPRICLATKDRDQIEQDQCSPLTFAPAQKPTDAAILSVAGSVPLQAERTYQLCVFASKDTGTPRTNYCTVIDVVSPFFQFPFPDSFAFSGNKAIALRTAWNRTPPTPEPYLKKGNVVVMGIVEPGFEGTTGILNARWLNQDDGTDTSIAATDPAEALVQLTDYCIARGDCKDDTTFILLAHMPRDAAALLSRRLSRRLPRGRSMSQELDEQRYEQFSLVISQTDSAFATSAQKVVYPAGHPPLTVVPVDMYRGASKAFHPVVQKVTLKGSYGQLEATTESLSGAPSFEGEKLDCLSAAVSGEWRRIAGEPPTASFTQQFQVVTLEAMRRNADVAVMQRRDFFGLDAPGAKTCYAATSEALRPTESLERILWKGDLVMTQTITGAALRAILKQSALFDKADSDPYTDSLHPGLGLVVLGALQNPDTKTWYVNGQDVLDTRLYSVAMTDFLAFGDTGYTDLGTPPVPPPYRIRDAAIGNRVERVTDLVAAVVFPSKVTPPDLTLSAYLDYSRHSYFLLGPAAGFMDKVGILRRNAKKPAWSPKTAEALAEERPYWRLFVDRGELGFTQYENNYPVLDNLQSKYAGIPESGVATPQSHSWSNAVAVELRREQRNRTLFARFEEEYSRTFTQQTGPAGSFLLSYSSNRLAFESGIRQTFTGTVRQGRWLGWIASFNGTTQVVRPLDDESVTLAAPGCPSTTIVCATIPFQTNLARTNRLLGKVGLRAETRTSWFEAGYFGGEVIRATNYELLEGSQVLADCQPWNFSSCLGAVTVPAGTASSSLRFAPSSASKPETGLFFNFNASLPVPKGYVIDAITFDNQGMWFADHRGVDVPIDARLNEKLAIGVRIALPNVPNLTLKPSYTIFLYENKIGDNLLFARTFDLKLEYRFDKASGRSWSRVLGFGRPR
jgi:hypothetical protein